MSTFNSSELLNQLEKDTREVIETVKNEFVPLNAEQLHWKPSQKEWSIIECLDHINIGVKHYLTEIAKKLDRAGKTDLNGNETFKSGPMGNYFVKMMAPTQAGGIKNKMATFKKFTQFDISAQQPHETIERFMRYQNELLDLLNRSRKVSLQKNRVKSAIGGWLMFRLGDAFRFIIGHNQRHVIQAQKVLQRMDVKAV